MSSRNDTVGLASSWPGTLLLWVVVLMSASAATAQDAGSLLSPGPLSRAHSHLGGLRSCEKCHEPGKGVSAERCLECHKPIARRMAAGKGVHREVTDDCVMCHVEHAGADADIRPLDVSSFDHLEETGFALEGLHEPLASDCARCHTTRSYLEAQPECSTCHRDVHQGQLGADCARCHSTGVVFPESGRQFDHALAAFPLVGAHATVDCARCHRQKQYRDLAFGQCSDCHRDAHEGTFGVACSSCHEPSAWRTRQVEHSRTGFPLIGLHAQLDCVACHQQPAVRIELEHGLCADCHQDPHVGVFTEDCSACHSESGFADATFDHTRRTAFTLAERHAEISCVACHKQAEPAPAEKGRTVDFRGLQTGCASCHADAHEGALGAGCVACHGTRTFRLTEFEHPRNLDFFGGRHAGVACARCHPDSARSSSSSSVVSTRQYRDLSTDCVACHRDVHLGQLGSRCEQCHTIEAERFAATGFAHESTDFPLQGKHRTLRCEQCHKEEQGEYAGGAGVAVRYRELGSACQSCHRDVHLGQLGDRCDTCHGNGSFTIKEYRHRGGQELLTGSHAAVECVACHQKAERDYPAGRGEATRYSDLDRSCSSCHDDPHRGTLGADCAACHSVSSPFRSASRAFHKETLLPLEGRHLAVPCADCHWNQVVKGTPTRCYDCHWIRRQDDLNRTRLGSDCERCHSPTSWTAVRWEHEANTGYRLDGVHSTIACESCHRDRRFDGQLSTDCVSCHLSDYNSARDPDHVASGFPTDCDQCHSAGDPGWGGVQYDHGTYPLVGTHSTLDCGACHTGGVFQGLPSECVDCHLGDYQATESPDHAAAGFPTDCEQCHGASDAGWADGDFEHGIYPLVGTHTTLDCAACHTGGVFQGLPSECVDCHLDEYQGTEAPDHAAAGFPTDCEQCHGASDAGWGDGDFEHGTYPLVGTHNTLDCSACHAGGVFQGLPSECVDCHLDEYQATEAPDHAAAGFPTDCEQCHGASDAGWGDGDFEHAVYPLVGTHTTLDCAACHTGGVFQGLPSECVDCHLDEYQATEAPDHGLAGFPTDCEQCHGASDAGWGDGDFEHAVYPLVGTHTTLDCAACHTGGVFQGLPSECVDCHLDEYQATDAPDHAAAGFPTDCEQCHGASDADWGDGDFEHAVYPLVGTHNTLDCGACHAGGVFQGLPSECVDCHLDEYQATEAPDHAAASFPTDCEQCHSASDAEWGDGQFDHGTYPLVGTHTTLDCAACHTGGVYQGLPSECVDCHLDEYQSTEAPDHAAASFPTDCEQCHSASDAEWGDGQFDHGTYPLVGTHTTLDCAACHTGGVYQGLPSECVDCHLDDYEGTDDPDHAAAGFPTDCELCHSGSDGGWGEGQFDHGIYPLVGTHTTLDCAACHTGGVYQGLPSECVDCHLDDYEGTDDPDHAAAGFPTDCELCHSGSDGGWGEGQFDHGIYPLVGTHTTLDCAACHTGGVYQGLPSECVDCHLDDYEGTDDPDHAAAGFPTDCELCHSGSDGGWGEGQFDHGIYPLVGTHTTLDCAACHTGGVYQGLPSECVDCHLDDYEGTDDPDHAAAGFPTDCELCHSGSDGGWDEGEFDHGIYPLVGTHTTLDCAACHTGGVYQGLPSECVDCHLDDYQGTDDPDHEAAGFPTDCELCHSGSDGGWDEGEFDHGIYPLVGTHTTLDCAACHTGGVYQGLPSECVDCHLDDYQGADDPDHEAAGFPTDCELCHSGSDGGWDEGEFDHGIYPLVGTHTTLDCADCHTGGVYQGLPSECVDCHLDDYQGADDPDHEAAGFPTDCELCHSGSDGGWDEGEFDHGIYPLVGMHTTLDCAACHTGGVYQGLPSECVDCHLDDYQGTDDPDHEAAGFPTDCELCHNGSDISWDEGVFDHPWFPIFSGDHRDLRCSECHPNPGSYAVFTCTTACHPRSEMDDEHEDVQGYVYDSAACYSCHPDGESRIRKRPRGRTRSNVRQR